VFFEPDEKLLSLIKQAETIAILTHIYPDGDALGSEIALADALSNAGKKVFVWNCHPPPGSLSFLRPEEVVRIVGPQQLSSLPQVDLIVAVDTTEVTRLGYLGEYLKRSEAQKVACDHHILPQKHPFDVAWAEQRAGATGVLVTDLLEALQLPVTPRAATALFVAIASDTGWFSFNNTGPAELACAGKLAACGASPSQIHRYLTGNSSLARTALLGEVLAAVQGEFDGRFVWSSIRLDQLRKRGLKYEELDGIVDELKRVQDAAIVALIIGLDENRWKVSLRGPAQYDVDTIARSFGGGGHAKAAGYRIEAAGLNEVLAGLRREVARVLGEGPPNGNPGRGESTAPQVLPSLKKGGEGKA